jgi:hypothetical protein
VRIAIDEYSSHVYLKDLGPGSGGHVRSNDINLIEFRARRKASDPLQEVDDWFRSLVGYYSCPAANRTIDDDPTTTWGSQRHSHPLRRTASECGEVPADLLESPAIHMGAPRLSKRECTIHIDHRDRIPLWVVGEGNLENIGAADAIGSGGGWSFGRGFEIGRGRAGVAKKQRVGTAREGDRDERNAQRTGSDAIAAPRPDSRGASFHTSVIVVPVRTA